MDWFTRLKAFNAATIEEQKGEDLPEAEDEREQESEVFRRILEILDEEE